MSSFTKCDQILSGLSHWIKQCLLCNRLEIWIWNCCWHGLDQGFSTFWCSRTHKSGLYPSSYPQIRIASPLRTPKSELYALRVTLNIKFYPKGLLLSGFLNYACPLRLSHVPLGERVPQVANPWPRPYLT